MCTIRELGAGAVAVMERFSVDVALGDVDRAGLVVGFHDFRGVFPPEQLSGVGFPVRYGMHGLGCVFQD